MNYARKIFSLYRTTVNAVQSKQGTVEWDSAVALLIVFLLFSSCNLMDNQKSSSDFKKQFLPNTEHIPRLPPESEREVISKEEIIGRYTGNITVAMDNKPFGPYKESITISETIYKKITITSDKTTFNGMPTDISYDFDDITVTPAHDDKSLRFTGERGNAYFYGKNDSKPHHFGRNTRISGTIWKKNGTVFIAYKIVYDTVELHKAVPILPKDSHNSMSASMESGVKQ